MKSTTQHSLTVDDECRRGVAARCIGELRILCGWVVPPHLVTFVDVLIPYGRRQYTLLYAALFWSS